jgi:FkbM family methyltransferase
VTAESGTRTNGIPMVPHPYFLLALGANRHPMADRRKIRWLLNEFFLPYVPESFFKAVIRCQMFNYLGTVAPDFSDFRMGYRHGRYAISYGGQTGLFHGDYDPWFELIPIKGYLRKRTIRPGDVVVDGGAYVGEFTVFAAKLCGKDGLVIAFEPDEENYQRLLANIELNGLKNVKVVKKGLWSSDGRMLFDATGNVGAAIIQNKEDAAGTAIRIEVVSLDEELARLGVDHVDFLKMDIEGAEIEAVRGARRALEGNVMVAIASYHIVDGQQTCIALEDILRQWGYRCETGFVHLTTYAERPARDK